MYFLVIQSGESFFFFAIFISRFSCLIDLCVCVWFRFLSFWFIRWWFATVCKTIKRIFCLYSFVSDIFSDKTKTKNTFFWTKNWNEMNSNENDYHNTDTHMDICIILNDTQTRKNILLFAKLYQIFWFVYRRNTEKEKKLDCQTRKRKTTKNFIP